MRGILRKVPYITVLLAMALYVGLRTVPHHHCNCHEVQEMHLGYGECSDCSHGHHDGCDPCEHGHDTELCCNDVEFCRGADDDFFSPKRLHANDDVAYLCYEPLITYRPPVVHRPVISETLAVPDAHLISQLLRAPPAL